MSQEYMSAQPTRRSWNPSIFPVSRADNTAASSSPTTSSFSTSSIDKRRSLDPSTILLRRNNSTGSKRNFSLPENVNPTHRRTNSVFSSSQCSSSSLATSISRSSSPEFSFDSLDETKQSLKRQQSRSQRWSSSSASLRYSVSEQERLLQEKLALLARTENLRLLAYENSSSAFSSPAHSRPVSLSIGESDKHQLSSIISSSPSFLHRHSSYSHLNTTFKALDLNESLSDDISLSSCDVARADALAKLSGTTTTSTSNEAPRQVPHNKPLDRKKKRSSLNQSGYFIISDQDLDKIGNETHIMAGPYRPGDIGGTVLSWRMASDLLKAWTMAFKSPEAFLEIIYFLWAMVSYPSNVLELDFKTGHLVPPQEIVQGLKNNVVSAVSQASLASIMDSLLKFSKVFGQGVVTSIAFLVIFIQVSLLSVMVFAYMLGEAIITPANYAKEWYTSKSEKALDTPIPELSTEVKALKAQRAARKSAIRKSRTKNARQ